MSRQIGVGLAMLALAGAFVWTGCEEAQDPVTRSPSSRATDRRGRAARDAVQDSPDLASLLREIPEYGGSGRNLFAFGSRPVPPPPQQAPAPPPPPPPPRAPATPTASVPRVDLKFAGYVETKTVEGETKKYAVFLDGAEILTGAEGDLVANRYRVVQIGLESVTVGVAGSNQTQQIPLRSN